MDLVGRVALVTGASGGIGRAVAQRLTEAGAAVIAGYYGAQDGAEKAAGELVEAGQCADLVELDQRSSASIEDCVGKVRARHGRLDILVNNAAWNTPIPFQDLDALTPDLWDRVLETNLRGPFLLARGFASMLKAEGGGHIVNIASTGGFVPAASSIAYASSKAGLLHLTRCLAVALAPEVAVNSVSPGVVENTGMSNRVMDAEQQRTASEASLLGRTAQLADIAEQVLALVRSTSVTGQTIAIDGGTSLASH
ncbi:SDR family NAD(P)-dependent oxidoreductase [Streptomyces sp. GQFP]|uniref:SDR family NAD(P)-dependent oxidoreductase n=1 Tax=Streptomyces sp. GQFP TaxID=2907545 RepID=UPI001F448B0D|nr:SDR family oxidoreductase [Streptomyces sp. GQFP]UIX29244.1 SDR family oxidoreductase [Streptomyces sp. GQFP]